MGNQMSVHQRAEEQENDSETDAHEVASKRDCVHNGTPVMVSTYTVQLYEEVDLGISVQEDSAAASSPKTVETSAVAGAGGKNLGKEAKPRAPAAKSHFFLPLSRSVPGRAGDRGEDSSEPPRAPGRPDVSSAGGLGDKGASDSMALRPAAARGPGPDKTPGLAATRGPAPRPPESGGAAPSKPKDAGFFNKLFKLDKGQEQAPTVGHQEPECTAREDQAFDIPSCPGPAHDVPAERDIVAGQDKGQEVTPVSCSLPRDPEELEIAKEDPQTTAITEDNNPIMSFFKTLVSPNKAETKKDLEDTGAEKSPATSADLKSDKATFVPQETQGAAKNPTPTETAKEGAKQKGGPSPLPLGKLFWKKSVKEEPVPTGAEENVVCESPVEVRRSQEVDSALQTVDLNEEAEATPATPEGKLKREERKPPTNSLMAFLRQMSVKGDGGTTHSEDINGKDCSYQTSHSAQKATTPPEPQPQPAGASLKGKEGSAKDKKMAASESNKQRNNKQEAKEPAPCACAEPAVAAVAQANALQNGDRPQRRREKRSQSFRGFFKGLGPKRMLDAQVQTDPVSIGPVGKSK
ncbi:breast carcinoma-amplified sequence 1 isoform X2 [Myotis yumanensis]|uniref:breast carcinoma-amplified sequence 1 isoform X2 n=1 Tax=Myotis yumanensis TaxID=159337 RepID=UPI0038D1E25C